MKLLERYIIIVTTVNDDELLVKLKKEKEHKAPSYNVKMYDKEKMVYYIYQK